MSCGESLSDGMFCEPRRMEILSCSLLVCRALSAQWRSVGAVAPERVVASFLCSRLVSCTCARLWMFILTHATALKPFHSKQSYPLHHLQHLQSFPVFRFPLVCLVAPVSTGSAVQQQCNRAANKGWRFVPVAILSGHRKAPQWVPARTPTAHWGLNSRKAVGGPFGRAEWLGSTCSRHDEETDDECVGLPLKQGVFPKHGHHQQLV